MKAKVLIGFYDKEANVNRKAGDVIEIKPARFNEITRKGRYVEAYVEPEQAAVKPEK